MLLVAPVREEHRVPDRRRGAADHASTTPTCATGSTSSRSDDPGGDARRLQRPGPDRGRGAQPAVLPAAARRSTRLTGCPVLVNTSFNVRGEPIVCTPEDAYRCFLATDMDVLVLEDIVHRQGCGHPAGRRGDRGSNTWPSSSSIERWSALLVSDSIDPMPVERQRVHATLSGLPETDVVAPLVQ